MSLAIAFSTRFRAVLALDLSCGTGLMVRQLSQSGHYQQVIALDYSPEMLAVLEQQMKAEGICSAQIMREIIKLLQRISHD